MLTVAEYRSRILSQVRPGLPEEMPLALALGKVLAKPLTSAVDLPGFDNSAMDGYAVCAEDVTGATEQSPVVLPVVGDIPAGDREARSLEPGSAWRIMTGAPMPSGADTVVQVEFTDGGVEQVSITREVAPDLHIRRAGEDVRTGGRILDAGRVLGVRELALAAAAGCATASVHPSPRVLVLSTGDELVPVGQVPGFGEVVDSNGAMLEALCDTLGVGCLRRGGVPDTPEAVLAAIAEGVETGCDAVVTTGGVSMGAYDAVKEALSSRGVSFEKVAMMPGKPQGFGRVLIEGASGPAGEVGVPVFTLPGNPVSAYVSFQVFVLPALQLMAGGKPTGPATVQARIEGEAPAPRDRTQYLRVRLRASDGSDTRVDGSVSATVLRGQGSHMLQDLADADALMEVPAVGAGGPGADGVTYRCLVLTDTSPLLGRGEPNRYL